MSEELKVDPLKQEILPHARYTPAEAAALLGFGNRTKTIYEVPERQLRRLRVGPNEGRVLFLGRDLIAYLERPTRSRGRRGEPKRKAS
jgi:hypothetical protein